MNKEKKNILIVEDEVKIAKLLRDYLLKDFFNVDILHNGESGLKHIQEHKPDLVILDIMLPEMDGLKVCKKVRETSNVPIIFLTAKTEELDKLIGFEFEADDYITKPFSPKEVVARVKAVLRRNLTENKAEIDPDIISHADIVLHNGTRDVKVAGKSLKLTPKEFGILKMLISRPGRVLTREDLLNSVMGYDYEGYDRTIDSHVKNLRKKMTAAKPESNYIESIYGIGYRLNEDD